MIEVKLQRTVEDIIRYNGVFCDQTCPQLRVRAITSHTKAYYCDYFSNYYNCLESIFFDGVSKNLRCQKCLKKFTKNS